MSKKVVIEGMVEERQGEIRIYMEAAGATYYRVASFEEFRKFLGKRVRVTIEELADPDEDCPPPTDADGRKASDNRPW